MKFKTIIFIILIALILTSFLYFSNRILTVSNVSDFKNIYNSNTNLEDINIDIFHEGQIISTITNTSDIEAFFNCIKDETIKNDVKSDETILGGAYSVYIRNTLTNSSLHIGINTSQITIHNKTYSTTVNIKEKLEPIMNKYY